MQISELKTGLCSIPEASAFLSISKEKLYKLIQNNEIPFRQFGRSVRIPWAWLNKQAEVSE
jgi:excisionase family DNA binding protein